MGMEDETRDFLVLIIQTISWILLWMMLNVYVGIYKDYAFFDQRLNWTNYLFYAGSLISLFFLVRFLWRKWKL
ncbi:MAG: hypothetical protein IPI66_02550 [Chitinophagaceae bacterium]|nr:hypothetical protein [Chitinophagaceae bacterium]